MINYERAFSCAPVTWSNKGNLSARPTFLSWTGYPAKIMCPQTQKCRQTQNWSVDPNTMSLDPKSSEQGNDASNRKEICINMRHAEQEHSFLLKMADFGAADCFYAESKYSKKPLIQFPSQQRLGSVLEFVWKSDYCTSSYYKCNDCVKLWKTNRRLGIVPCITVSSKRQQNSAGKSKASGSHQRSAGFGTRSRRPHCPPIFGSCSVHDWAAVIFCTICLDFTLIDIKRKIHTCISKLLGLSTIISGLMTPSYVDKKLEYFWV